MTKFYSANIDLQKSVTIQASGSTQQQAEQLALKKARAMFPGFSASVHSMVLNAEAKIEVGIQLKHALFGVGVVVASESGRVQIDFGERGVKWLATHIAPLSLVEPEAR